MEESKQLEEEELDCKFAEAPTMKHPLKMVLEVVTIQRILLEIQVGIILLMTEK